MICWASGLVRSQIANEKWYNGISKRGHVRMTIDGVADPVSDYLVRPWKKAELLSKCKLYYLEGVACRRTLTQTPAQFNLFVKEEHWQ